MRGYKRRQFLVDALQYRLLLVNLAYFLAVVLTFAAVVFAPAIMDLSSDALGWDKKQEAADQFLSLHARVWPAILVLFALLVVHSVIVSHRIAGPLYRFRRVYSSVQDGDLTVRAVIRKRDYLQKDADSINQMIGALCEKVRDVEMETAELGSLVEGLKKTVGSDSIEMRALVDRIDSQLAQLVRSVTRVRTKPEDALPNKVEDSPEQRASNRREPQPIANSS